MKVIEYFKNKPQKGEVGIEIELEGKGIHRVEVPGWRGERDGSLRGDSIELVLPKPIPRKTVLATLSRIPKAIEEAGVEVIDTGRAGVHIHVNVQELTITQVFNFVCAYMIFEDTLINFCGEHRVGNLFCLRVRDADRLLQDIRSVLTEGEYELFEANNIRYASINLCAMPTYGSLEFRAMRSSIDPQLINNWAMMLLAIKDWSLTFDDPRDIVMAFSQQGPERVFEDVFGPLATLLGFDIDSLYDGVRNAQYVAFSLEDWELDPYLKMKRLAREGIQGFVHRETVETLIKDRGFFFENLGFARSVLRDLEEYLERKDSGLAPVGKKIFMGKPIFGGPLAAEWAAPQREINRAVENIMAEIHEDEDEEEPFFDADFGEDEDEENV